MLDIDPSIFSMHNGHCGSWMSSEEVVLDFAL